MAQDELLGNIHEALTLRGWLRFGKCRSTIEFEGNKDSLETHKSLLGRIAVKFRKEGGII